MLEQEAVAGIRIDHQPRIGDRLGQREGLESRDHDVLDPVRHQDRLADRADPGEERGLGRADIAGGGQHPQPCGLVRQHHEGIRPLRGEDIARTILWAVTQPPHVNIDEIVVTPVSQANSYYNKKEM